MTVESDVGVSVQETAHLRAELERIFAQIDEIDARIEKDHAEIDRLKASTQARLKQLEALVNPHVAPVS